MIDYLFFVACKICLVCHFVVDLNQTAQDLEGLGSECHC